MKWSLEESKYQEDATLTSKEIYVSSLDSKKSKEIWEIEINKAKIKIKSALEDSSDLTEIAKAISVNGGHIESFRFLLAPPKSQDQFKIISKSYKKSLESSKATEESSILIANDIKSWMDSFYDFSGNSDQFMSFQRNVIIEVVSRLMASQKIATYERSRSSSNQEQFVISDLISKGWERINSPKISRHDIINKKFAYKLKMDTVSGKQEIDIACGIGSEYVVAVECKSTNDATNSIKRINDIIKKRDGWVSHWGSFVKTAAILQGVISNADVRRLIESGVHVFWSHDLNRFSDWLDATSHEVAKK